MYHFDAASFEKWQVKREKSYSNRAVTNYLASRKHLSTRMILPTFLIGKASCPAAVAVPSHVRSLACWTPAGPAAWDDPVTPTRSPAPFPVLKRILART